jgi:phosphatidylinositol-3-phosphatase
MLRTSLAMALLLLLVLAALMPALDGTGAAPPTIPPSSSSISATADTGTSVHPSFLSPIQHVIVVYLENEESTSALSQPFEAHLAYTYAYAKNYYAITHPSAPNYLAGTSASVFNQTGSDNYNIWHSVNLGNLVQWAGETWTAYDENMPAPCDINTTGSYAVKHNPFPYYYDIVKNHATECNLYDLPQSAWNTSVATDTVPNYVFYTPNLYDDGHNSNVQTADAWLQGWLTPLLNDSFFQSSVFLITYDEGATLNGYNGTAGGNVYMVAVSPYAHLGYTATKDYSHYDLVTTVEWLLGLTPGGCGHNDNWTAWPPMRDLFQFPRTPGPQHYVVQGTVQATDGSPIGGATVSTNLGNSTTTAANGTYRLVLINGSYVLTGSAAGYLTATQSAKVAGTGLTVNLTLATSSASVFTLEGRITTTYPTTVGLGSAAVFANATGGGSRTTSSAPSGDYSLQVPNGTWTVSAFEPFYSPGTTSVVVSGAAATWANLTLSPHDLAIIVTPGSSSMVSGQAGHVTVSASDPDGNPAAGVTLTLTASPVSLPFTLGGSLTILPNGTAVASFVAPSVPSNTTETLTATVASGSDFPGTGSGSLILLVLTTPSPGAISGVVENASSGAPLSGASVQVFASGSTSVLQTLTTGGPGTFLASSLPAGTYTLRASDPGYGTAWTNASVVSGATTGPVTFKLAPTASTSSGKGGGGPSSPGSSIEALLSNPYVLLGLLVVVVGVIAAAALARRRRRQREPARPPSAYPPEASAQPPEGMASSSGARPGG